MLALDQTLHPFTGGFSRRPAPVAKRRVLVVDDSHFMQKRLTEILESSADLEVIGHADNGVDAIHMAENLRPDVITMDINMGKMDGLQAIDYIMRSNPRPIVVVSSYTRQGGRAAMYALQQGVIDIVEKPSSNGVAIDIAQMKDEIVSKVRTASRIRVVRTLADAAPRGSVSSAPPADKASAKTLQTPPAAPSELPALVAIGSSTGGPVVLRDILRGLPADYPLPIAIVQHLPPKFTRDLADQLNVICRLKVVEAVHGQKLAPGTVFIAPGGHHMELDHAGRVQLVDTPPVNHCRPAVDVLFKSLARVHGPRVLGCVLTGMGEDGAAGSLALRRAGATVLAQDEDSCVVFGMPRAVIKAGAASAVMSADAIHNYLKSVACTPAKTDAPAETLSQSTLKP